jgi:enoyl-CoA hydratase/carnithine racemase
MSSLSEYQNKYKFIKLSRDADGVLTVRFHSNEREFIWGFPQHSEVADCLLQVSRDRENKVVIVTGTGDVFLNEEDMSATAFEPTFKDFCSYHMSVGYRLIQNHLDIEVPMIGVLNGPAGVHAELAVMCDIVLAADDAYVADSVHFPCGIAPGDGVHIVWPELLGINRGRYFLLMGEKIDAQEAKRLGVVAEVMPRAQLQGRAKTIAADLARRDTIMLRHTRAVLVQRLRKQVAELMSLGLFASFGAAMAAAQDGAALGDLTKG